MIARLLTEHYAGAFPVWLAPVQVAVFNITDAQADYARDVASSLQKAGFRAITDPRNEKIGYKIREHTLARIPYLVVVGDREKAEQTLSVRALNGDALGTMTLAEFSGILGHGGA